MLVINIKEKFFSIGEEAAKYEFQAINLAL